MLIWDFLIFLSFKQMELWFSFLVFIWFFIGITLKHFLNKKKPYKIMLLGPKEIIIVAELLIYR